MFVRFLCNWPPYKAEQAVEIPDRIGADFVARCMAQIVTAADVREHARTMETIDRRVARCVADYFAGNVSAKTAKAGRRTISEDEWRRELGQKGPAPFRRIPATLTVRS
jgi:hypothetical protein